MQMNKKINLEEILEKHFDLYTTYSVKNKAGVFTSVVDKKGALKAMRDACEEMAEACANASDVGPWSYKTVEDMRLCILKNKKLLVGGEEED